MEKETVYKSGLISQSFWFNELKKVIRLKNDGLGYKEIKNKCVEENLFGSTNEYRALRIAGYIISRLKTMDNTMIDLFLSSDLETQKLINLITILRTDRLFFEFIYEVYREKAILGVEIIDESDVNLFFTSKETQNDLISGWTDATKKRLRSSYLNFMTDANLLTISGGKKTITPPIMDMALERYLKSSGDDSIIKALTGVK